ncbi:GGDEF domain-containing protein [Hwanghaeella grinnelliae]|uniref:diguanylate cyclase n=1 Tax=Hwanghaeella grinnelliae TaxID=2500179 RepID=A0A3S3UQ51_9PROT|nr:GGDEF domain-containing protein [Hwanghaeella grinnelliae]RVU37933.1 GGDEF domain-containing protein [Hwanghaeella grinnelliae]
MEFSEGLAEAMEFAQSALALMESNSVPPTPENFAIWYAHATGRMPDLSKEVAALLDQPGAITPERNREIYERYLGGPPDDLIVQRTGARMEEEIAGLLSVISSATGDAENFQTSIQENLRDLTKDQGFEGITRAMKSLVDEAQKMQSSNSEMQRRLEASSKEIVSLRENLAEVQREALTDGLTGIANRKMFDMTMDRAIETAARTGEPFCLAMTDIDFFKKFNDNYGHQTGDQVLKLVAKILEGSVRDGETAARYGGEEFALILPGSKLDEAHVVCERVRELVSSKQIRNRSTGESMGNITLSLGIALFKPGDSPTDLVQRADAGLYFAKQHGRNQTVVETQLEAEVAAG